MLVLCLFSISRPFVLCTPPTLSSTTPPNGVVGFVPGSELFQLRFSEFVVAVAGGAFTFSACRATTGGSLCAATTFTLAITDASVDISTNTVAVPLSAVSSWNYCCTGDAQIIKVELSSGALENGAGEAFGGLAGFTFYFTLLDTSPPSVVQPAVPAIGATNVAVTTVFIISGFGENVVAGAGSVHLTSASQTQSIPTASIPPTVIFNNNNQLITVLMLNPPLDLAYGETYTVTMDGNAVKDYQGNSPAEWNNWYRTGAAPNWFSVYNFTTVSQPLLVASALQPANRTTGVAGGTPIVLTFTENIQASTGNVKITMCSTLKECGGILLFTANNAAVAYSGLTMTITINTPGLAYSISNGRLVKVSDTPEEQYMHV